MTGRSHYRGVDIRAIEDKGVIHMLDPRDYNRVQATCCILTSKLIPIQANEGEIKVWPKW